MQNRKEESIKYYLKHKEKIKERNKLYQQNHKEKYIFIKKKAYQDKKREEGSYWIERYQNNKKYSEQYRKKNREKINQYTLNRKKQNPELRVLHNLRSRLYHLLKGKNKSKSTLKLLGCSIEKFKKHLEILFTKGMTWDNHGKWHIDHIIPCHNFDLSNFNEQNECFNYANLQPLWKIDNLRKAKI